MPEGSPKIMQHYTVSASLVHKFLVTVSLEVAFPDFARVGKTASERVILIQCTSVGSVVPGGVQASYHMRESEATWTGRP